LSSSGWAAFQILDVIEASPVTCQVLKAAVGKNSATPSSIGLQLFAPNEGTLQDTVGSILKLAASHDVEVSGGTCCVPSPAFVVL
jgi:hypothetical protein